MKIFSNSMKLSTVALVFSLVTSSQASHALPTSFERELKSAAKTEIGKKTSLAVEKCKWSTKSGRPSVKCSIQKFDVTVNSFSFKEMRDSIGFEEHTYEIDVTLENYSSEDSGLAVGSLLRCSNSRGSSSFYAEGLDPQFVLGRSQERGVVVASFPSDVTASNCANPTLWLSLSSSGVTLRDKKKVSSLKKRKLVAAAYIPLTNEQISK